MRAASVLGVLVILAGAGDVWAAAGSFDPSFGTGGHVITDLGPSATPAGGALLPGGRLVVGGRPGPGPVSPRRVVAVRYQPDGTLDPTFGTGGIAHADFGIYMLDRATLLLPDGKLLVLALSVGSPSEFALMRFTTDGALDATFGGDGVVEPALGGNIDAVAAALQPDGKILVAADTSFGVSGPDGTDVLVIRFLEGGTLDPSFGAGGIATVDFAGGRDDVTAMTLQPDGRIIVAGFAWADPTRLGAGSSVALARLDAGGSLDATFGTGGITLHTFGKSDTPLDVLRLPDGKLIIAGSSNEHDPDHDFSIISSAEFLLGFDANGVLDASFGTGGVRWLDGRLNAIATRLGLAPDGTVVWIGSGVSDAFAGSIGVGRFHS